MERLLCDAHGEFGRTEEPRREVSILQKTRRPCPEEPRPAVITGETKGKSPQDGRQLGAATAKTPFGGSVIYVFILTIENIL